MLVEKVGVYNSMIFLVILIKVLISSLQLLHEDIILVQSSDKI